MADQLLDTRYVRATVAALPAWNISARERVYEDAILARDWHIRCLTQNLNVAHAAVSCLHNEVAHHWHATGLVSPPAPAKPRPLDVVHRVTTLDLAPLEPPACPLTEDALLVASIDSVSEVMMMRLEDARSDAQRWKAAAEEALRHAANVDTVQAQAAAHRNELEVLQLRLQTLQRASKKREDKLLRVLEQRSQQHEKRLQEEQLKQEELRKDLNYTRDVYTELLESNKVAAQVLEIAGLSAENNGDRAAERAADDGTLSGIATPWGVLSFDVDDVARGCGSVATGFVQSALTYLRERNTLVPPTASVIYRFANKLLNRMYGALFAFDDSVCPGPEELEAIERQTQGETSRAQRFAVYNRHSLRLLRRRFQALQTMSMAALSESLLPFSVLSVSSIRRACERGPTTDDVVAGYVAGMGMMATSKFVDVWRDEDIKTVRQAAEATAEARACLGLTSGDIESACHMAVDCYLLMCTTVLHMHNGNQPLGKDHPPPPQILSAVWKPVLDRARMQSMVYHAFPCALERQLSTSARPPRWWLSADQQPISPVAQLMMLANCAVAANALMPIIDISKTKLEQAKKRRAKKHNKRA